MNKEKFFDWLDGHLSALELKNIDSCSVSTIRKKMNTMSLQKYAKKVYSQNGEDGITMKLIELLYNDPTNKKYVEFGVESGEECNTRVLYENYGWNGLMMDGTYYNTFKNLQLEFITKENILELFKKYEVPKNINLLGVDIDMNDWYVLKEIIKEYTADIIIVEYNAIIPPTEAKVVSYDPTQTWDGTDYFGASLLAYNRLLEPEGYILVCTDPRGVNAFFVKTSLLEERNVEFENMGDVEKLYTKPNYQKRRDGVHRKDFKNREYIKL